MSPQEVIRSILENQPKSGWAVYRFNWSWAVLGFFVRALFVALFGVGAWILLTNTDKNSQALGFGILLGVCAAISAIIFLLHILTLIFGAKNMIVLTEHAVVKSFRGKIMEFPYSSIRDLRFVREHGNNRVPEHCIEFTDSRSGRMIELARNHVFGSTASIIAVLRSKVR